MRTDKQLVDEILNGNFEYFTELVNKYYHRVNAFIRKMNVSREDAEDISQEVFIRVYNKLYQYNEGWSFSTWLFKIAVNTHKNFVRKKRIATEMLNDNLCAAEGDLPDKYVEDFQRQELVSSMLGELDEDTRAMIILHYFNDLTLKEIAKLYRTSPNAVKMKIFRARARISKAYKSDVLGGEFYEV